MVPFANILIVRRADILNAEKLKGNEHRVVMIYSVAVQSHDPSIMSQEELLVKSCVSQANYLHVTAHFQSWLAIIYQRKPSEMNIGRRDNVLLELLKAM